MTATMHVGQPRVWQGTPPRQYAMVRHQDVSSVSGSGLVAWVTEYPGGKTTVAWCCGPVRSVIVYDTLGEVEQIHGHDGKTELIPV